MLPPRAASVQLMETWVQNVNLRKHMLAVEAAMRAYATQYNGEVEFWGQVGLLHDFDYERYPSPADHPRKGVEELRQRGYPEEFLKAILAHAPHTHEPRDTQVKKCIFAVDELCGFLVAVALVRPSKKLADVTVQAVMKKMKDKAFARQVNREEMMQGARELGVPLEEHVQRILTALQAVAPALGL